MPARVVALPEQNDQWLLQHRYMQIERMAELTPPLIDVDPAKLPPMAARPMATSSCTPIYTSVTDVTSPASWEPPLPPCGIIASDGSEMSASGAIAV
jgi:hypothetical protein